MNLITNYNNLNVVYIPGLGGSILNGEKFKFFKEVYPNIHGFQWDESDDLDQKLTTFITTIINPKLITLIIGSSAGGKIALLMKQIMLELGYQSPFTCLLNPLANVNHRLLDFSLSNPYLITGNLHLVNQYSLIIWSAEDEVINQIASIKEFDPNNTFIQVNDDHSLRLSMSTIVKRIDEYTFHNLQFI